MAMLFPYFELAASLFILLLAFQIWTRHYENKLARFYSTFALISFFAAIFTYSLRIAFTLELARDINRISATLWAFAFAMFFHFVLIFTKKERFLRSVWGRTLVYLPPTILGVLFIFTNWMYQRYEIVSIGIISQPAPLYTLFLLQTAIYCIGGVVLLWRFAQSTPQPVEKKQALIIALGSATPVIIGLLADQLLPLMMGGRIIFPTVVFDIAILNFFIFLAMRNYSLFAISPALAADTIIDMMPDSLLVTDLGGRILFLNRHATKFFHVPEEEISGRHIKDLFRNKDDFFRLYEEVVKQGLELEGFKTDLVNPRGETIPTLINAQLLCEKLFGEKLGIVFIVRV